MSQQAQTIKPTERYLFLLNFLDLAQATGVPDAQWEHFQQSHLLDSGTFRIETKSRQIAWSWITGAESVADAILDRRDSIFVSINQEEAKEKIRYAHAVYEALRIGGLPKIVKHNELNLEFANGARLSSVPAKPPRGRARANIYLDEFAHVKDSRKIYGAAMPVISKGGRIRIGSSPLGATGLFWEIYTQSIRTYPGYSRKKTPWWEVKAFCTDVATARSAAPMMDTLDRVDLFGTDRIKAIHANVALEDFQQEYECAWVDETTSWITWDEIKSITDDELICHHAKTREKNTGSAYDAIDRMVWQVDNKEIEHMYTAGLDIGRTKNTSELFLVGVGKDKFPLRLMVTMDNMEFDDQYNIVSYAIEKLPIIRVLVDQNGIGRNIAENLWKRYSAKVEGVDFGAATKQLWATDAKMMTQQKKAVIPNNRDLAYQIHSIKRIVTQSNNLVFDTEKNEKHHADMFWAWALALSMAKQLRAKTAGVLGGRRSR